MKFKLLLATHIDGEAHLLSEFQHNQLLTKCKILGRQISINIELAGESIADHLEQKQHQQALNWKCLKGNDGKGTNNYEGQVKTECM